MNLPDMVYLTSDFDVSMIYKNFLEIEKTDSTMNFRNNAKVILITPEILSPFYEKAGEIRIDEFIAILAIFYNKIFHQK